MKKIISTFLLLAACFMLMPAYAKAANNDDTWEEVEAIERQEDSIEKTEKMANKFMQIVEMSDVNLSGIKIAALGDSITDFGGWVDAAREIAGCEIYNLGVGGSAIGDYWDETSLILRWNSIPADANIIVIFAGINDYFINPEFGDKGQAGTYCGDTWNLFNNIKAAYSNADIYVITTYKSNSENWEQFEGRKAEPYMQTQIEYAEELGFKVIDIYNSGYLNSQVQEIKEKYVPDEVHTNEEGAKLLAYDILANIYRNYESAE